MAKKQQKNTTLELSQVQKSNNTNITDIPIFTNIKYSGVIAFSEFTYV